VFAIVFGAEDLCFYSHMPPKKSAVVGDPKQAKLPWAPKEAPSVQKRARDGDFSLQSYLTDKSWHDALQKEFSEEYFTTLETTLAAEYSNGKEIFPPREHIFAAFNHCPLDKVKVVLLGQDPYHDNNQAHGLCFSVQPGIKTPPSLVNMYKELTTDIPGFKTPPHGYLIDWADQGILMLNATLTVEAHKPNSHAKLGWQMFTDRVIKYLNDNKRGIVFLLWGGFAQKKGKMIDMVKHRVVANAHPSPLSATAWFGCRTFSKCNAALKDLGKEPINWSLPMTVPKP
jgi:uracil-DNA glycosylase